MQLDYKDYRDGNCHKVLTLSGEELLRRFLLHVLPKGFMRGTLAFWPIAAAPNASRRSAPPQTPRNNRRRPPRPRRLPLSTAIRVLCADRVGYGSPLT